MRLHNNWFHDIVIVLCGWEVIALTTRRIPTLTSLHRKYKVIAPVILAGLAIHFYVEDVKWQWISILKEAELNGESEGQATEAA